MNLPVDSLPKTEIVRPVKAVLRQQHGRSRALELIQSDRGPRATSVRRTSRSKNRAAQECRLPCDWFGPPAAFGRASSLDSRRHYFADPPLHVHGGLIVYMLLLLPPYLAPPRPPEPSTPHSHLLEASARAGCGKLLAARGRATASSSRCCGDSECARCPEHCACRDGRSDMTASPLCSMRIYAANWPARAGRPPTAWARFEHAVKPCRTYCCVEVRMSFFQ